MSVMVVGVDRSAGAREAILFVSAALLAEILRRGRRS